MNEHERLGPLGPLQYVDASLMLASKQIERYRNAFTFHAMFQVLSCLMWTTDFPPIYIDSTNFPKEFPLTQNPARYPGGQTKMVYQCHCLWVLIRKMEDVWKECKIMQNLWSGSGNFRGVSRGSYSWAFSRQAQLKTKLFRETSFKTYLSKPRLTSEFSDFEMMPHKYCSQLLFLKEVSQKSFVFELSTKVSSSISWLVGWLVG